MPSTLDQLTESESRIKVLRQLQNLIYYKVIYGLKKVLWSLHRKLQPVIVFQQAHQPATDDPHS